MQIINYRGYGGIPSQCGYGGAVINGKPVIVFEHKMVGTSPQNLIEELTSVQFNQEFPGISPSGLRVFEVDFSGQGLFTYQEVEFQNVGQPRGSLWNRISIALGFRPTPPWYFRAPKWNPLTPADQAWLQGLINAGTI